MKTMLFVTLIFLSTNTAWAQTAVNFTCNDCAGVSHDLYTELDAGKVIVLCWVMPCGSCVGPSLTTQNVVNSFALTHPGRVKMYIVDDYANTSCNSLNAWANANNLNPSTRFSNASIKMSDYGTPGMPKVVVTGNWSHQVYYNSNNTVNATALQTAIAAALEDYSVGITDTDREQVLSFFPNPAVSDVTFRFKADGTNDATLKVYDLTGKLLDIRIYSGLDQGVTTLRYSMEHIPEGVYLLRISDGHSSLSGKVFLQK